MGPPHNGAASRSAGRARAPVPPARRHRRDQRRHRRVVLSTYPERDVPAQLDQAAREAAGVAGAGCLVDLRRRHFGFWRLSRAAGEGRPTGSVAGTNGDTTGTAVNARNDRHVLRLPRTCGLRSTPALWHFPLEQLDPVPRQSRRLQRSAFVACRRARRFMVPARLASHRAIAAAIGGDSPADAQRAPDRPVIRA